MTILDLVRIMRSNFKLLLLATLLGTLLAAAYTMTLPVQYTTNSTVQVIGGNSQDMNSATISEQLATSRAAYYAKLASSQGVSDRIVQQSKGGLAPGDFSVAGASSDNSATVTLTAVSATPAKAQRAADLARSALAAEAKYLETLGSVNKTTIYEVFPITTAAKPSTPSSPSWPFNLAAGALLGFLGGIAVVVLRKQLDSRVRHSDEVEKLTGAGVLGVIPRAKNLANERRGGLGDLGTTAEAFRMLRTNLRYVSTDEPPRSLVITSAVQGEGKSTIAANLARVLAAAGQSVVLVDTDLRRPTVHETFGVENLVGLTEVLTGQAPLREVIQQGDHKNLAVITAGRVPPNPSELLGSRRMSAVIEALAERYFVVLDAPPLLPVTDAGLLAVAADGAAVVYHHGKTHREQVALCTKILDQVGARYFGSILNLTPPKEMGTTIYGYGAGNYGDTVLGYGGYGQSESPAAATALTPSHELRDLSLDGSRRGEQTDAPTSSGDRGETAVSDTRRAESNAMERDVRAASPARPTPFDEPAEHDVHEQGATVVDGTNPTAATAAEVNATASSSTPATPATRSIPEGEVPPLPSRADRRRSRR